MAALPTDGQLTAADAEALERANAELRGVFGAGRATVTQLRERLDAMMTGHGLPDGTTVTELSVGGVPALRVTAAGVSGDDAAVIWLHGGGYLIGSPHGYRGSAAAISAAAGHPVILPDYRLAPENPYPAALHDANIVMEWAASSYGDRWVLAGDSAGGGLTVAALLHSRDQGGPLPAGAVLMSPLADLTASGASFETNAGTDAAISRPSIAMICRAYLGEHDPRDPYASPVFGIFHRLPSTLILASDTEVLLDDARMLHEGMRRDGVAAQLSVYAGVCHAWTMFTAYMPRAQRAAAEIGEFVRRAVG